MSNTTQSKENKVSVSFAATDKYLDNHIVSPTESVTSGKVKGENMVLWGVGNAYPEYLLDLYNNVTTLRTIINGCVDFVVGDGISTNINLQNGALNKSGDSIRDIVKLVAGDYYRYGGFALQIIRDTTGKVAEILYCDLRFLRMNEDGTTFYYSEEFTKKYARSSKVITYPKFMPGELPDMPSSILYVKNTHTQTYPTPLYAASVKACEIERCIDNYHLNAINNGFAGSLFVNFNNGIPDDAMKAEIENDFNEKFSGSENAARIGFSWNPNKESATTFEQLKVEDFGEQYQALARHSRQQIFTSFRAIPALFGLMTESTGFSSQEFGEAFKLFNRTQIQPVQDLIAKTFDKIMEGKDTVSIVPFSLGV